MLVLARKKGESIMIGDNVELVVLGTEGDTVKIGIRAPKNVQVFRKEIYDSIQESNKAAIQSKISVSDLHKLMKKGES